MKIKPVSEQELLKAWAKGDWAAKPAQDARSERMKSETMKGRELDNRLEARYTEDCIRRIDQLSDSLRKRDMGVEPDASQAARIALMREAMAHGDQRHIRGTIMLVAGCVLAVLAFAAFLAMAWGDLP